MLASDRSSCAKGDLFTLEVLRCNPEHPSEKPHWQSYSVELTEVRV
ncbi:MAG: fumarate reductase iron-sulfur subunit [Glaciecola sp.]|jgi:fumarate reductase iron-sulfur subunit